MVYYYYYLEDFNVYIYVYMFNVYMDGVVRDVNVRVLGKGLELLSANGGRFEINQLLFPDDTALVAALQCKAVILLIIIIVLLPRAVSRTFTTTT